jgi:hypothetical protein
VDEASGISHEEAKGYIRVRELDELDGVKISFANPDLL